MEQGCPSCQAPAATPVLVDPKQLPSALLVASAQLRPSRGCHPALACGCQSCSAAQIVPLVLLQAGWAVQHLARLVWALLVGSPQLRQSRCCHPALAACGCQGCSAAWAAPVPLLQAGWAVQHLVLACPKRLLRALLLGSAQVRQSRYCHSALACGCQSCSAAAQAARALLPRAGLPQLRLLGCMLLQAVTRQALLSALVSAGVVRWA